MKRSDIVQYAGDSIVGIELGVAEAEFSDQVLSQQPTVNAWYSVDMWAGDRGHDFNQQQRARRRLEHFGKRSTVIHAKFDRALLQFPDEHFDIVYVDGYAHTGQEGGQTLEDWWPKVKPGGVLSGDDYDAKAWPLTVRNVDLFCEKHDLQLHIHEFENKTHWSKHPSWYVYKEQNHA